MKVEINIKDADDKTVHSVMFTISKIQFEALKMYLAALVLKFRRE